MLSREVVQLERENDVLKNALKELSAKMEQNAVVKPKSCQYCKNYVQHYMKNGLGYREYTPIYDGHCTCGVPVSKGRKRNPKPDDTCPYFEIGTLETKEREITLGRSAIYG